MPFFCWRLVLKTLLWIKKHCCSVSETKDALRVCSLFMRSWPWQHFVWVYQIFLTNADATLFRNSTSARQLSVSCTSPALAYRGCAGVVSGERVYGEVVVHCALLSDKGLLRCSSTLSVRRLLFFAAVSNWPAHSAAFYYCGRSMLLFALLARRQRRRCLFRLRKFKRWAGRKFSCLCSLHRLAKCFQTEWVQRVRGLLYRERN